MEPRFKEYSISKYAKMTGESHSTVRRKCERGVYRAYQTEGGDKRGGSWRIVEYEGSPYMPEVFSCCDNLVGAKGNFAKFKTV